MHAKGRRHRLAYKVHITVFLAARIIQITIFIYWLVDILASAIPSLGTISVGQ